MIEPAGEGPPALSCHGDGTTPRSHRTVEVIASLIVGIFRTSSGGCTGCSSGSASHSWFVSLEAHQLSWPFKHLSRRQCLRSGPRWRASLLAPLLVVGVIATSCGSSEPEASGNDEQVDTDTVIAPANETAPSTVEFVPETSDGTPFLDLDLDGKTASFLDTPNTIFAAIIASEMGLSGEVRWAPWLLDIVLVGGAVETSNQGLRALSTLTGISETGDVIIDFATFGAWTRTEDIDPGIGYEEWKTRLYGWIIGDEYEALLSDIDDRLVLAAIQFGGVRRGDIPELNEPRRISAEEATFMTPEELVLGVFVDNVPVAYQVRFLARHELANDHIAGKPVSLVYCTLCRSAILFDRKVGDLVLSFETSGLLLDSNKVMVDAETDSLWHHLSGEAISGQMKGTELVRFPVETTTWADWLDRHPDTETLDTPPPTIFQDNPERAPLVYDYSPDSAYAAYYGVDELWFPAVDPPDVYEPKEEVITVALDGEAVAFSVEDIARSGDSVLELGRNLVLVVPSNGGARVYDASGTGLQPGSAFDVESSSPHEAVLDDGSVLPRIVSGQSFWFAWYGLHPETATWQPDR